MNIFKRLASVCMMAILPLMAGNALAGDAMTTEKAAVQTFYDLLSNPGSAAATKTFSTNTADSWESIGDYSGKNKSKGAFLGQMGFFAKLMPDLNWKVEEMIQSGNRVVVRGRASGTPKGPLFGVDGKGKSFEIMTIDIHTVENGKIVKTHHLEDWAGALQQLKGDKQSAQTLAVAKSFLKAAGSGDGATLKKLMADDFVWHNEGDSNIPWIGDWKGQEQVFGTFMPAFGAGLKVTSWATDFSFADKDRAVFMGSMSAIANNTGKDTGKFSWAVRVHVVDGKVKRWNWFEDSFAVSQAYTK